MKAKKNRAKQLSVTLFALLMPLLASAEKVEIDGIWYNLLSKVKTAEVTFKGASYKEYWDEYSGSITIPTTVTYEGVTYNVTSIGSQAFYCCTNLTDITISEGVTSIGEYAFRECTSLSNINIPESVTSIGNNAFTSCHSLTTITIPKNVTSIGEEAFTTSNLTTITIPEGVKNIGRSAFKYCIQLISVTISGSVESIGGGAFEGCSKLNNVTMLEGVTSIENDAFYKCSSLTSITLPESLTSIGVRAFCYCSNLASITLPESLTSIGYCAFYDCYNLKAVHISSIESWCNIKFEREYLFGNVDNSCNPLCYAKNLYLNEELVTELTIPEGVTRIGDNAFSGYSRLTSLTISEGVTHIGDRAFNGCSSLTTITLPEGMRSIGNNAFFECSSLKSIVFPKSIDDICNQAFANCPELIDVYSYAESVPSNNESIFTGSYPEYATLHVPASAIESYSAKAPWSRFGTIVSLDAAITRISLSASLVTLTEGETITLTMTTTPENADNSLISWSSNNPSVATVDNTGKVTAIASGTATITATANDGSGVSASCEVRVLPVSSETQNFQNVSTLYYTIQAIDDPYEWSTKSAKISFETINNLIGTTTPVLYALNSPSAFIETGEKYSKLYTMGEQPGFWLTQDGYHSYWGDDASWGMTGFNSTADDFVIQCVQMPNCVVVGDTYNALLYLVNEENKKMITINLTYQIVDALEFIATYLIDGCVYKQVSIKTGHPINLTDYPIKEGYTFQGWEGPTIMPARDVEIIGTYEINKYSLKYMLEGKVYKEYSVKFKEVVPKAGNPIKEGYTFCGWSEIPDSMPAHNVNIYGDFIVNYYEVSYVINQDTIFKDTIAFGDEIPEYNVPIKEGYTFNGWDAPQTMPAKNIVLTGSYTINKYQLSYVVDGELYYTIDITYNDSIVPLSTTPYKEGYTFMGWSKIPEVMPARDLTISGTFKKNKYLVSFIIDDVVIVSDSLEYGDAIIIPTIPNLEGHTFSGWGEVAETVPANDVTYSAYYIANVYKVYYFVGSKLVNMVEVTYGEPIPEYIYEPTTEGDEFLGWVGDTYETMPAHDVTYTANIESGINQITIDNGQLNIYDLMGRKVTDTENLTGGIYIIGGKKVIIK